MIHALGATPRNANTLPKDSAIAAISPDLVGGLRPALTEQQFQQQVTDLADLRGLKWVHFRPARTTRGWRTPVSGPLGVGFVDLVLVRRDRIVFAEIKTDRGRVTAEQAAVIEVLGQAAEAYIFRPRDWDEIDRVLT